MKASPSHQRSFTISQLLAPSKPHNLKYLLHQSFTISQLLAASQSLHLLHQSFTISSLASSKFHNLSATCSFIIKASQSLCYFLSIHDFRVPTKLKLLNFAHTFADCRVQILAKMKN
jgi:hypothetical protein